MAQHETRREQHSVALLGYRDLRDDTLARILGFSLRKTPSLSSQGLSRTEARPTLRIPHVLAWYSSGNRSRASLKPPRGLNPAKQMHLAHRSEEISNLPRQVYCAHVLHVAAAVM